MLAGGGRVSEQEALRLAGLSKTFPGTKALDSVAMDIRAGEVHALMGQNGSGKSTLIKILAGFYQPDAGAEGRVRGEPFRFGDAHAAHAAGLRFVHQDLGLVGSLDTVDNLALGFGYTTGFGQRIRWRHQERRARLAIEELGHGFDVRIPVERLPISDQTAVAIARALQDWEDNVSVLVLDEPTAAMPLPEIGRFLATVRRVVARGTSVLYVSHHLGEVFEIAARMTVLRDGTSLGTHDVAALTKKRVVELMTGEAGLGPPPIDWLNAAEATLVLPAASVAVAIKLCEPTANARVVKVQAPLLLVSDVPSVIAPSNTVTVVLPSALPFSVTRLPLTASPDITGAAGTVESIIVPVNKLMLFDDLTVPLCGPPFASL